jgi:hypothetical protein
VLEKKVLPRGDTRSVGQRDSLYLRQRSDSIYSFETVVAHVNFDKLWNKIFDGGEVEALFFQYCQDTLCAENIIFYRQVFLLPIRKIMFSFVS